MNLKYKKVRKVYTDRNEMPDLSLQFYADEVVCFEADRYYFGHGQPQNYVKAFELYKVCSRLHLYWIP